MSETVASLETISEEECHDLLVRHDLGRVAVVADGQPLIFPVNYAYGHRVIGRACCSCARWRRGSATAGSASIPPR